LLAPERSNETNQENVMPIITRRRFIGTAAAAGAMIAAPSVLLAQST
jgi:hypothetical protein